ncbi:hypothetical protein CAN33_0029930 [Aspergillus niger]|uniref:Xylanase D n=1 Tax=Aspergillus niger TaxID=5061 RepID=A0A254UEV5_ASPNG|nr:hypothetical protein CAN33_0029930 [Aspergillus niger]SPB51329.1 unnamed protein product [Aspergillus niger]
MSHPQQNLLATTTSNTKAGNPVFPGWYADPEARLFNAQYWIYPTYSADYSEQTFFDAFSSPDLLTWTKHPTILNITNIPWSTNRAAWAPSVGRKLRSSANAEEEYDYFMYFSVGDGTGIGVAKSTTGKPEGPYEDVLGEPLVNGTVYGAEAIDAQIFQDDDGRNWLYFGGWSHAVVVELGEDMISLKGDYLEITPEGWGDNSYGVSYVTADSPTGPFSSTPKKILQGNDAVGTSTGHNSVFTPDGQDYYIVYHRRYVNDTARDHRVTCIDRMYFNEAGEILPVNITLEGVEGRTLS